MFVCGGVGDCKAYAYRQRERIVEDFTACNREFSENDASDPGGRIGPYLESRPDLRNCGFRLAFYCISIVSVSDYSFFFTD